MGRECVGGVGSVRVRVRECTEGVCGKCRKCESGGVY